MNSSIPPLDELLSAWHAHLAERRQAAGTLIAEEVRRALADATLGASPAGLQLARNRITQGVWTLVGTEILPACLAWLRERDAWPATALADDLGPELVNAQAAVPPPQPWHGVPGPRQDPFAWVVPCALGGLLGGLALDHWGGALAGSVALVAGLAWLLGHPAIRARLEADTASARPDPLALAPANALIRLGTWLAGSLLRFERPARQPAIPMEALRQTVADYYGACAGLVLATCWARATAPVPTPAARDENTGEPLGSTPLYEAIGTLTRALETVDEDPQGLTDAAQELAQTFANEGYAWKTVTRGSPFEPSLLACFNTFGHIEEGQPVKMLQRALCKDGQVLMRGVIKKL